MMTAQLIVARHRLSTEQNACHQDISRRRCCCCWWSR